MVRVGVGEGLPRVTAPLVGGGEITLPDAVGDEWAVVLFYRGHWCPYCRQQLTDFQRNLAKLTEADVAVVALSVDDKGDAETTVDRHALQFPVAYGLDPVEIRDTFGSYLGGDDSFVQATGFVLRPGGLVELAVYSSGAVGRLVAADVLGLIQYARKQE
ncbi:MAG: redoxin domain-containing protein [Gammaproteobacteria bacterium]|nr:peroxiredoxin family protein [Gemmatimonadota bacterium]NIU74380.1 redoxin domain-containing protein [Gammaproteobacteria bacterium]